MSALYKTITGKKKTTDEQERGIEGDRGGACNGIAERGGNIVFSLVLPFFHRCFFAYFETRKPYHEAILVTQHLFFLSLSLFLCAFIIHPLRLMTELYITVMNTYIRRRQTNDFSPYLPFLFFFSFRFAILFCV